MEKMNEELLEVLETPFGLEAIGGLNLAPAGCDGCEKWNHKRENTCDMYDYPEQQHTRIFGCAARTHNKVEQYEDTKQLNPLKASKRSMKHHALKK